MKTRSRKGKVARVKQYFGTLCTLLSALGESERRKVFSKKRVYRDILFKIAYDLCTSTEFNDSVVSAVAALKLRLLTIDT